MFEETYRGMNEHIRPTADLMRRTRLLMEAELARRSALRGRLRKPSLALVWMCVFVMVVSIPVMAATVSSFNDLLYRVAPEVAQLLRPVELSCVDNGIEMKVVAAVNDGERCVVYLTLQDLTGDRIDETVDLYNYRVRGFTYFTHHLVDYDEETGKATICIVGGGSQHLAGKKATVHIDSFLSKRVNYTGVPLNIDLSEIAGHPRPHTMEVDGRNVLGVSWIGDKLRVPGWEGWKGRAVVLKPQARPIPIASDIDFVSVSATGYIDGLLHVQTMWDPSVDNHGSIYLAGENGDLRGPCGSLRFILDEDRAEAPYGTKYVEYAFEISEESLPNYKAYANLTENKCYTEGDWEVTFKIEPVEGKITLSNVAINGETIDSITVTPLGLELESRGFDFRSSEVQLVMEGGEVIGCWSRHLTDDRKASYFSPGTIDLEQVKEIRIDGVVVPLR